VRRYPVWIALVLFALVGFVAAEAAAWVPPASKIVDRVASANRKAGRSNALAISVALGGEGDRNLARGELLSDPRGVARLELASSFGTTERHLLRGGEYLAARGGSLLAMPPPYLPPLFLLQASSSDRVRTGLLSLGGLADEVVLGRHEGAICWVMGGRDLSPPANASAALVGSPGPKAAIWVTRDGFRIIRIDRLDGTRFLLGPPRSYDGIELPQWIQIDRPGVPTTRLEILAARPGRFDDASFGTDWLQGR